MKRPAIVETEDSELADKPIISLPTLTHLWNVGKFAVNGAAVRAGVKPTRTGNGRLHVSFRQAQAIGRELTRRSANG